MRVSRYTEGDLHLRCPFRSHRLAAAALLLAAAACAAVRKHEPPISPWQVAEAARAQLAAIPSTQRTVEDYRTVMDAYRLIYHADPGDLHAPESIFTVGNLLVEEGVVLHDARAMQAALGQYEFLRKQYPASSLRIAALLEEAHVAAAGLHDAKLAGAKYGAFVEQYPRSAHVEEARSALATLRSGSLPVVNSGAFATVSGSGIAPAPAETVQIGPISAPRMAQQHGGSIAAAGRLQGSAAAASNGVPGAAVAPSERTEASLLASERKAPEGDNPQQAGTDAQAQSVPPLPTRGPTHTRNGLALVSSIRHWSTPTYTRVAIDLGDEVKYEAARVPHPDRIYFDLHGTRLGADLIGKSFEVVDDGFLKRIRAAQYSNDSTRIVLDVNDVTEYSAFLLPNPYRLIIDIHGGARAGIPQAGDAAMPGLAAPTNPDDADRIAAAPLPGAATARNPDLLHTPDRATMAADALRAQPAAIAGSRPAPSAQNVAHAAHTAGPASGGVLGTAPGTLAVRSASAHEVDSLSQQTDKVEATAQPTTQPIAVVANRSASNTEVAAGSRKGRRVRNSAAESATAADISVGRTAVPNAEGERSLMRALGLKVGRIVIDPGHGGHDSGTIGAGGIMEKDVVLDVALRLGKLLHERLGAEILYTRTDDTFIPLETRTAIANKAEADLFLSIHANSSQDVSARGVETYYLNFTSQADSLDVAARENAVSDQGVHELADMVKKITLKDKIEESREFAQDVEASLYDGLQRGNAGLKNRGVKKAPFVVLIGANMPSVLTEISFVTNPQDARALRTGEYRQKVAQSIYGGVARYAQGLGGMRVASSAGKPENARN